MCTAQCKCNKPFLEVLTIKSMSSLLIFTLDSSVSFNCFSVASRVWRSLTTFIACTINIIFIIYLTLLHCLQASKIWSGKCAQLSVLQINQSMNINEFMSRVNQWHNAAEPVQNTTEWFPMTQRCVLSSWQSTNVNNTKKAFKHLSEF